nr:LEAF RUST 10 DISEASE-RESISTANCE LOCUS RECEPTOR-LIKE PROTEIN KINASE-like 2.8 [Ziziphus jujuba var. spinosa]
MNWRLSSSSSPFLRLSFSWLLLVFPPCSSMDVYGDCSNRFNCGNITDVEYPFWGEGRPSHCGHPDLKLSCHHGSLTTIKIKQVTYNVLQINEKTQILKISRDDLFDGFCSPKFPNTTFDPDEDLFEYAPVSQQFTILYDCPSSTTPKTRAEVTPGTAAAIYTRNDCTCAYLDCPSGSAYKSAFMVTEPQAASQCNLTLIVGVLRSYVNGDMGNLSKMEEAMRQGFAVKYKVDSGACRECTESGGSCGYNWTTNQSICYCEGHNLSPWMTKCPPPPPTTGQTAKTGIIQLAQVFLNLMFGS